MRITAIEKAKGERYTVYVDDEYWYILNLEIIMQNSLQVGTELDEEELEELKRQAERRTARERAYYLLGYRDHSKKELYDKLLKSVRSKAALEIVELMEEQGLLNDERYAKKLAAYYLQSKKWGGRKALFEMIRRGIDRETAQEAIDDCEVDTLSQIRAVVDRKYSACLEDNSYKGRQKVLAALSRMGYSYDDIRTVLSEYRSSGTEEEYEE